MLSCCSNLWLPGHTSHGYPQQTSDSYDSDDPDIICSVHHCNSIFLSKKIFAMTLLLNCYVKSINRSQKCSYTHHICDSLSKSHCMHCHGDSIGKGKDEADGPAQLWTKTATDQEIGPTYWWWGGGKRRRCRDVWKRVKEKNDICMFNEWMKAQPNKPPFTFPLVAMAEVERPVIPVMHDDSRMMTQVKPGRKSNWILAFR